MIGTEGRMRYGNRQTGLRLRVVLEQEIAIGPGKAELLEGIRETGSISAAGRRMGMSYRRAWLLVDTMNRCFQAPLVEAHRGGREYGGASLTATGKLVLSCYRRMESLAEAATRDEMDSLRSLLAPGTTPDAD